jgi:tetratricopeptide (TPR) repeat protein
LDLIPKSAVNETQWNNIKGSAMFYRAYNLLNAALLFSSAYDETSKNELGIVIRLTANFNETSKRNTLQESYEQVIIDATEAAELLPPNPEVLTRPSKAAAYGLLARTYLLMRQYEQARSYAELSLAIKHDIINYNDPSLVKPEADLPFKRFNKETIFYAQMNQSVNLYLPQLGALIDTVLYNTYHDNDIRKRAFFKASNGYYQFKGTYAEDIGVLFTGIATDEMYLTRAECNARLNNKEAALTDLNTLLANRYITTTYVPLTVQTTNDVLATIILERRKELLMRGLRWGDIKRYNKEGYNITLRRVINDRLYELPPNDKRFALPLPIDIVQQGVTQNKY